MSTARLAAGTALALLAFAGNSLLCRLALQQGSIDAASFTSVRLVSGALFLAWLLHRQARPLGGHWVSALALWGYAAAFSFAYIGLTAATGALILFGSVQLTMTATGLVRGERLAAAQWLGLLMAAGGLVYLLLPGVAVPAGPAGWLMVAAGVAWGVYSLRGRGSRDALADTAGNFVRAVPMTLALSAAALLLQPMHAEPRGVLLAVASGALASGAGYAVWYAVLPRLKATQAATLQLSVPVLAAIGGVLLLGETFGLRLLLATAVVLAGVGLVTLYRSPRR